MIKTKNLPRVVRMSGTFERDMVGRGVESSRLPPGRENTVDKKREKDVLVLF